MVWKKTEKNYKRKKKKRKMKMKMRNNEKNIRHKENKPFSKVCNFQKNNENVH